MKPNGENETCECAHDKASHFYDGERKETATCLCANCPCKRYKEPAKKQ